MSVCRSCRAQIEWAYSEDKHRPVPIDAKPVAGGTIILRHTEVNRPPVAHVTTAQERIELERQLRNLIRDGVVSERPLKLFVSHFATCPQAGEWRKSA